jgi:replicative DNA helicase Mcm
VVEPQLTVQDSVLSAKWESFLQDYCKTLVQKAAEDYPDAGKSVTIAFNDLQLRDPDLADYLLHKPRHCFQIRAQMLQNVDVTVDPKPRLHLRVSGLPESAQTAIRHLRVEHLGRFVAVEGLVKKATEHIPQVLEAAWDCKTCGNRIRLIQDDEFLAEPVICDGCEKPGPWTLREEECRFIDHQKIEMQESPDGLRGSAQAARIVVHIQDDLVGKLSPGDRVRINGIVTVKARREAQRKKVEFKTILQAVTIEVQEQSYSEIKLSPEQVAEVEALAATPDVYTTLKSSFAPTIYGNEDVKEGLLLSCFGGVGREVGDTWHRGDIHVLMVGDPGLAKSQLLRYISKLSPRAVMANGKASTAVGLTAAAVKDDLSGGSHWTLEAGALVLANEGICCIDELDKMGKDDIPSLYESMEQQTISVTKAGISASLKSRCAVIAGANPTGSKFDPLAGNLVDQIGFVVALLSRFDLPFGMVDRPNADTDRAIARQILSLKDGRLGDIVAPGCLTKEQLRNYIAYSKRISPILEAPAAAFLEDLHAKIRASSAAANAGQGLTHRVIATLHRLTVARARAHLRRNATLEDAQAGWELLRRALSTLGILSKEGTFDMQLLYTGVSHSQHDRMRVVQEIVRELCRESPTGYVGVIDVVNAAGGRDIPYLEATKVIETLRRNNSVFAKGGPDTVAPLNP